MVFRRDGPIDCLVYFIGFAMLDYFLECHGTPIYMFRSPKILVGHSVQWADLLELEDRHFGN